MSDIIQLLPDSVANQIAAGEVIQRPASVVKELIENAVDAGSTEIKVNITDAGKTLIQIIDNGCGMSDTDARMAFERHATSKIRKATDLFEIRTLGFRGEALASIAAIAQVTLKTKRIDDELGTQISISASEVISQESVTCSSGSNFIIKNLFYNIPARRKFLKSNATEIKYIISEFQRVALTNPQIKFSLIHNNVDIFHLENTSLLQRISQLFRKNINQSLIKISTDTSIIKISGFIGKPENAKKSLGEQFFFVNNRYMRHPYFNKAVLMAYENILPSGEYPSYFIYLDIDSQAVDINIHPTKTEIKFEDEVNIWKILNLSVKESIGKFNISPSLDFETKNNVSIPANKKHSEIRIPEVNINPEYNPFEKPDRDFSNNYSKSANDRENIDNWEKLYQGFHNTQSDNKIAFPDKEDNNITGNDIFFQFKNMFILSSVKSGLMVIDQRRAHIKILFENYKVIQNQGKAFSQKQMFPVQIEAEAGDILILDELMPELYNLGFELEKKQGSMYSIIGTPADIKNQNPGQLIESLLEHYKNTGEKLELSFREKVALSLARASAINHGKLLDNEEMTSLFNGLFSCSSPTYTPDGKLIVSILETKEIEERFK